MRLLYNQEADFRQRRDFGQKFTATFEFIGAHWHALGRCLLYLALPAAMLQGIITGLIQSKLILPNVHAAGSGGSGVEVFVRQMAMLGSMRQSPYYWLNVALGAVFSIVLLLTVYGYVLHCLRPVPSAEPIEPRQVWEVVKREFLSSYLSYFGLLLLIIIGLFLLAIPGIYLSIALTLFFMVKLVEGQGFLGSCQRSEHLVRGKWWSTFGLVVVMLVVMGVIMGVLGGMLSGLYLFLLRQLGLGQNSAVREVLVVVMGALGGLLNLLLYPPLLLALAFQYFNLVERRDGTGLHQLVSQIGQAPLAVANADLRADEEGEY